MNLYITSKSTSVKSRTQAACDIALESCATIRRYVGGWKHKNHPGQLAASKRHAPLYHGLGCTIKLTFSSFSPFRASIKTTPESVFDVRSRWKPRFIPPARPATTASPLVDLVLASTARILHMFF